MFGPARSQDLRGSRWASILIQACFSVGSRVELTLKPVGSQLMKELQKLSNFLQVAFVVTGSVPDTEGTCGCQGTLVVFTLVGPQA